MTIERKPFVERPQAKQLLLTVLGELVLPRGGAWTQAIVSTMARCGIDERNARQALARTAASGLLERRAYGRRVWWELSSDGHELLRTGAERIYGFGTRAAGWDGRWIVVICSVPDNAIRARLRMRLAFLGFGFLPGGIAVSPHVERSGATHDVMKRLGLTDAIVLTAEADDVQPMEQAWDLDGVASAYRAFLDHRWPRDPLAALVLLVHEWRRFPSLDPELPAALLPARWPGSTARTRFHHRRAAWSLAANRAFDELA